MNDAIRHLDKRFAALRPLSKKAQRPTRHSSAGLNVRARAQWVSLVVSVTEVVALASTSLGDPTWRAHAETM